MSCCLKGTIPAFEWLTNEAIRREDFSELIRYIRASNRVRQSYHVNVWAFSWIKFAFDCTFSPTNDEVEQMLEREAVFPTSPANIVAQRNTTKLERFALLHTARLTFLVHKSEFYKVRFEHH